MEQNKNSLTSLKDIIGDLMSGSNLPFNPENYNIWKVWDDVVGQSVARHARPIRMLKGKLLVEVSESIWLQELEYLKDTIKTGLNERLGRNAVKKIDFRLTRG